VKVNLNPSEIARIVFTKDDCLNPITNPGTWIQRPYEISDHSSAIELRLDLSLMEQLLIPTRDLSQSLKVSSTL